MGSFDFTYCDNGTNIRKGSGYIYITDSLKNLCNLPNPIRFTKTDEYGNFTCQIGNNGDDFECELDIYALHAVQLYLEKIISEKEHYMSTYIVCLKNRMLNRDFRNCEDVLRLISISYVSEHMKYLKNGDPVCVNIPALKNQEQKKAWCFRYSDAELPMLISKKLFPTNYGKTLCDIAANWGFVSGFDPNQGFRKTKNYYVKYQKPNIHQIGTFFDWLK